MSSDPSQRTDYDVFIIGAGIAACTFARRIIASDPRLRVGMADAGAQHSRRVGENLKNFRNYQDDVDQYGGVVRGLMHPVSVTPASPFYTRNALNPRQDPALNLPGAVAAYSVGGMAVHWTCAIPRQHPTAERIDDRIVPGAEWDTLYPAAEALLGRNDDVHTPSLRHQAIKAHLSKRWPDVTETPLAARRINGEYVRYAGADTVLGRLADPGGHPGFDLLREHRVSRLIYGGGRVSAAMVRDLVDDPTGERPVHAKAFVVAAGWVHTAQILWNSWIRPPALGRYLTDHTFTACQVLLKPSLRDAVRAAAAEQGRVFDPEDKVPIPMEDPPPHLFMPVRPDRPWHGQIFREAFVEPAASARANLFSPLALTTDGRLVVDLKWFGMVDPVPENRVAFEADVHDRHGMPQPTFDFRLGHNDQRREALMMEHMEEVARELGEYLPTSPPGRVPLGASTHTMGATRMGSTDDGTSVVDPHSRVWGFDNLFLAGNCVLPNRNACNPTLTSVALALRASGELLRGIGVEPAPLPLADDGPDR